MLKQITRFLPIILSLIVLVTAGFSLSGEAIAGETGIRYFIKPIQQHQLLVVEPNFGHLIRSEQAVPEVSKTLRQSLAEIRQDYEVQETQLIHAKRNILGKVPSLLVYVQPKSAE